MCRRIYLLAAVLCLPPLVPLVATAQQEEAPIFTYVTERNMPSGQSGESIASGEQPSRPVLERLLADGTIVSWGEFASVVHAENGATHGTWWAATSIAAIERVRAGLLEFPPGTEAVGAKHHDHLLRSLIHRSRPAGRTSGYLWVSAVQVKPDKGQQWRELWEKYVRPTYDELLANGTILMYEVAVEEVHTEPPGRRYVLYVAPDAEAVDKVRATLGALARKSITEETLTIGAAFAEVTITEEHRDFFARLLSYAHK